jgi:hypothetical protein
VGLVTSEVQKSLRKGAGKKEDVFGGCVYDMLYMSSFSVGLCKEGRSIHNQVGTSIGCCNCE